MNFEIEHDACGIGTVVQIDGKQSYDVVDKALHIVEKLEHRAGKDASGKVGDGVGILLQISDGFFKKTLNFFNSTFALLVENSSSLAKTSFLKFSKLFKAILISSF